MLRHAPAKNLFEPFGSSSSNSFSIPKATKHYGVTCSPIWDENAHRLEEKYWDSWEGVWRCKTIKWLINKVRFIPWKFHANDLTIIYRVMIYGNHGSSLYHAISNVVLVLRMMTSSLALIWNTALLLNPLKLLDIVRLPKSLQDIQVLISCIYEPSTNGISQLR